MNESTVSSALMKQLREALSGSVVVKHRDASMIGLPDCSVTFGGHALWLEFKLFDWARWMENLDDGELAGELLSRASGTAPTQLAMMRRLGEASWSLYIMWVKKTCVVIVDPCSMACLKVPTTAHAVKELADRLLAWGTPPKPAL